MRERRVDANAQNLSISSLEFLAIGFEVRKLLLSTAGKIERIKDQDNVLFSPVVLQGNILLAGNG
jgi:hypothetical protein